MPSSRRDPPPKTREDSDNKRKNIVNPYFGGLSEKLKRIFFSKHDFPVHFRPRNTLGQRLVHPKDKTPRLKLNNVVYATQNTSGQDSAVHLHLQGKGHSFKDSNVHIPDREDRCLREE